MAVKAGDSLWALVPCAHRCLHRDLQGRAKAKTLTRYYRAYEDFAAFVRDAGEHQGGSAAAEIDRLACEYRDAENLSKTNHIRLLTAIEFYLPELKRQLRRTIMKFAISKSSAKGVKFFGKHWLITNKCENNDA